MGLELAASVEPAQGPRRDEYLLEASDDVLCLVRELRMVDLDPVDVPTKESVQRVADSAIVVVSTAGQSAVWPHLAEGLCVNRIPYVKKAWVLWARPLGRPPWNTDCAPVAHQLQEGLS